jgi:hypothetical protein
MAGIRRHPGSQMGFLTADYFSVRYEPRDSWPSIEAALLTRKRHEEGISSVTLVIPACGLDVQ